MIKARLYLGRWHHPEESQSLAEAWQAATVGRGFLPSCAQQGSHTAVFVKWPEHRRSRENLSYRYLVENLRPSDFMSPGSRNNLFPAVNQA